MAKKRRRNGTLRKAADTAYRAMKRSFSKKREQPGKEFFELKPEENRELRILDDHPGRIYRHRLPRDVYGKLTCSMGSDDLRSCPVCAAIAPVDPVLVFVERRKGSVI